MNHKNGEVSNGKGYETVGYEVEKIAQDYIEGDETAKSRLIEAVKREVEG